MFNWRELNRELAGANQAVTGVRRLHENTFRGFGQGARTGDIYDEEVARWGARANLARAAEARTDTTQIIAEEQNRALRDGVYGNVPNRPWGMSGMSTPGFNPNSGAGIPQGRQPGVPQQGGQQQPAPAPAVQQIPIAQLNDATVDLKARTDLSLKDRVSVILGAKDVKSVDGRVLQGSERAAAVLNELNAHVRLVQNEVYSNEQDKNAAIAAARGEVRAELDRVMADPSLRHNFSAFVAEGIKTPQDKENLQTALNNFTAVSGTENAAALQRHMQNLASPSAGRGAAAAPAVNPQLQAARQQRDAAAAAIEIKAPDGAPQDRNTRAAQLNAAYKESLTPPAEGFAGVIQTIVKMIGHAIDQNNPRHMDSHQILALAEREGLRVEGKDNLERANRAVAAARGQTAPAPAAAAPAPAVAEASAAATAPAAPAAAPAPPAPAVAEAPAAPAAAANQAAGEVLLANRGKKLEELVAKANAGLSDSHRIGLNTDNTEIGLPTAEDAKTRKALERFDKNKDNKLDSQEIKLQGRAIEEALGSLAPPPTPSAGPAAAAGTVR